MVALRSFLMLLRVSTATTNTPCCNQSLLRFCLIYSSAIQNSLRLLWDLLAYGCVWLDSGWTASSAPWITGTIRSNTPSVRRYNFMVQIIIQTSQPVRVFLLVSIKMQSCQLVWLFDVHMSKQEGLEIFKNFPPIIISTPNTMQQEKHAQVHPQLPFKLAKLISNQVVNSTDNRRGIKKEEVTLEVLETLLMGVLLRNGDNFQACLEYYLGWNEEDGMTQSSLVQWICRPEVCNTIAKEIQQEYDNVTAIDLVQEEPLAVEAPSSPPASPLHVKMEARKQGEQSASTARSTRKEEPWQSIFEVINLCSEESSYQNSDIQESNEEVMIYTHEQIVEELNFQLEGQNVVEIEEERMVDEPQVLEPQALESLIPEEQFAAVQAFKEFSVAELQQMLGQQSSLCSSSQCGHFLFGDKLRQILDAFYCQGTTYFLIAWQPNKSITAKPSLLSSQTIKTHSPQELIHFYQSRLQHPNPK